MIAALIIAAIALPLADAVGMQAAELTPPDEEIFQVHYVEAEEEEADDV